MREVKKAVEGNRPEGLRGMRNSSRRNHERWEGDRVGYGDTVAICFGTIKRPATPLQLPLAAGLSCIIMCMGREIFDINAIV